MCLTVKKYRVCDGFQVRNAATKGVGVIAMLLMMVSFGNRIMEISSRRISIKEMPGRCRDPGGGGRGRVGTRVKSDEGYSEYFIR